MLHLLNISWDPDTNRIHLRGFDKESKTFVNDFQTDHPEGYLAVSGDKSASQAMLEILHVLEGEVEQFYEVISISEISEPNLLNLVSAKWQTWRVFYRNKD